MLLPLSDCSRLTGLSRSGLLKAISRGRVSAQKDPATGQWAIDSAELSRVYPIKSIADTSPPPNNTLSAESSDMLKEQIRHAEQRLADLRDERDYLRRRLDEESAAVQRLTAILTDQRQTENKSAPMPETPQTPDKHSRIWILIAILSAISAGLAVFIAIKNG